MLRIRMYQVGITFPPFSQIEAAYCDRCARDVGAMPGRFVVENRGRSEVIRPTRCEYCERES